MPTRNVVLTEHHQAVIDALVASGRYQNASEVLREGLRLLERREQWEAGKLELLRAAAQVGFDDLDAGRSRELSDGELDEFVRELGETAMQRSGASAD